MLAAESAKARLAKVDGTAETELSQEFAVTEYPTLKFFRDGNRTHPEEYTGTGGGRRWGGLGWARAERTLRRPPRGRRHRRVAEAAAGAQCHPAGGRGGHPDPDRQPGCCGRRLLPGERLPLGSGPQERGPRCQPTSQAWAPQDLQDEDVATFLALAQDALDMTFGLTDQPELFQKFGLTRDTVVLFKKVQHGARAGVGGRGCGSC